MQVSKLFQKIFAKVVYASAHNSLLDPDKTLQRGRMTVNRNKPHTYYHSYLVFRVYLSLKLIVVICEEYLIKMMIALLEYKSHY